MENLENETTRQDVEERSQQRDETTQKRWNRIQRISIIAGIAGTIIAAIQLFVPLFADGQNSTGIDQQGDQNAVAYIQIEGDQNVIQGFDRTSAEEEEEEEHIEEVVFSIDEKPDSEVLAASSDLIQNGDVKTAEQVLTDFLNRGVSGSKMRAASYYNRGLCRFLQGNYSMAADDFKNALSVVKFPKAYFALGAVYTVMAEPDYEEAIKCYDVAIELEEKAGYFLARAAAYEALGDSKAAEEDYRAVLKLDAGNEEALKALEQYGENSNI